ncbi:succinic semialdehyde dehydrogenase [Arthrobacter sp. UM1]|uniref:succinic semialdehyde dehydrogenase n=1 Tax=Arthrobacter sp. UM1 TaxID=2766776 RepID=UPI001CF688C6|nr:succinic semialdehyde dehydrogenase [Arthrobacter sp. UM1]MCB4207883.1 aldehyde dehydrogenase family protein [Arthrobacter sp. UM1]
MSAPRIPGFPPDRIAALAAEARGEESSGQASSIEPFSGETLARYAAATEETVASALEDARRAQAPWAARSARSRARWLGRLHGLLAEHREEILTLVQAETGKSRIHAFDELMHVLLVVAYYARTAPRALRTERRRAAVPGLTSAFLHRHPHGVVGHISPWNYPLSLGISDAIAPLVAGNAILHKPDSQTALVTLFCRRLAVQAGLDPNLWQVVVGEGSVIGPAISESCDFVAFTGSTKTGVDVATRAAQRMIGTSLELGGKNGMLVTADADLQAAAKAAVRGCFSSAGQLCVSMERVYVERPAYERFREAFRRATADAVLGAGYGADYDIGTLTGPKQLERVEAHVEDARSHGASVVAGGRARPDIGPFAYEPTILEGVTPEAACFAEETFGPLVSLYPVDSVEEGVEQMNSTPYGLNASVWAGSRRAGHALAARIESGTVNVNEMFAAAFGAVDSPMQGYGLSGNGGRHGREALEHLTWTQTVAVQNALGFGVPEGVSRQGFMDAMTAGLRLLRALRL